MDTTKKQPQVSSLLRGIYQAWVSERPAQLAAALAYFGLFSIAPMILMAFTIANMLLDEIGERSQFYQRLEVALGAEATQLIQDAVQGLGERLAGGSSLVTLVSFLALLFAASGMFFQIQFALNSIFKTPPARDHHTKAFILQRLFSFLMVLGVGLLVILAAVVNIIVNWFGSLIGELTGMARTLPVLDTAALWGLITLSFALVYKILPEARIGWRDVWPGAALAAGLVLMASALLGNYFSIGGIGSAFEAAGTFAVILIAINIFAQIFLFGALFTREYMVWFGETNTGTTKRSG